MKKKKEKVEPPIFFLSPRFLSLCGFQNVSGFQQYRRHGLLHYRTRRLVRGIFHRTPGAKVVEFVILFKTCFERSKDPVKKDLQA